jgi:diguanylate cyclase (GGDEF)-like protein
MPSERKSRPLGFGEDQRVLATRILQTEAKMASQAEMVANLNERLAAAGSLIEKLKRERNRERREFEAQMERYDKFRRIARILVEELYSKATKDSMTGLLNKESFFEVAEAVHEQLQTEDVLLMVDIDDFKGKNTRYGHLEADRALLAMAELIKDNTRPTDFVGSWPEGDNKAVPQAGRYGGEEFVAVFPKAKPEDILKKFAVDGEPGKFKINLTVRLKVQETGEYENVLITVSGALVNWEQGETVREALAKANRRLNEIKGSGKNRIEITT